MHSIVYIDRAKYANVRGCVLVDLVEDLVDRIIVSMLDDVLTYVLFCYRRLPTTCKICRQRGHLPCLCPH